jgi:hypothetical protein
MRHEIFDFEDASFEQNAMEGKRRENEPSNQICASKEVRPTNNDHRFGISVKNCLGKPRLKMNLRMHLLRSN